MSPELAAIGRRSFAALGTFRRSGVRVVTPVWIARDGDTLVVRTEASTGKVKRLRNDPRITLQECSRTGRVRPGAKSVDAIARLDDAGAAAGFAALGAKYGWQWRIAMFVQGRRAAQKDLRFVLLRITDPGDGA